jgi:hypothetical protein
MESLRLSALRSSFPAEQLTMSLKGSSHSRSGFRRVKNRFRNAPLILDGKANDLGLHDGLRRSFLREAVGCNSCLGTAALRNSDPLGCSFPISVAMLYIPREIE